jgi:ubiquinone/menaquinone biosynthesis C-methylase UbiE
MGEWVQKRRMMQRYDLTAHIYGMRYAEEQTAKIEAALKNVNLEKRSLVLDVGCGTGLLFDHVAEKVETIVGLDVSRKVLSEAKMRSEKHPNVHLIWADADNMPFRKGTFNYVFAVTLLQNMPNLIKTLDEVKRVTKKDATIVVTGLKKKFPLQIFETLLCKSGLHAIEVKNETLKCHVAICSKDH